MRKKKSTSRTSNPVTAGAPSFDSFHDGVFADAGQARSALAAIGKFLRAGSSPAPKDDGDQPFHGFAIESTRVEYRVGIQRIRMQTRFASGTVVLVVPAAKGEPEGVLEHRETRILAEFAKTVYEAQMRSSFQFWRALDKNAQEKLLREFGS